MSVYPPYETKNDVPENTRKYLETVSQTPFDDLDLLEINDFLHYLNDWIDENYKD